MLSILILDDEQGIREELEEYFLENNYDVYKAGVPSEAYQILEQNNIDVMILDLRLPEESGFSTLKKVKEKYPDVEVIVITAYGDMSAVLEVMRLGAFDFFTKPFRAVQLQNAIEKSKKFIALKESLRIANLNCKIINYKLNEKIGNTIIGKSKEIKQVLDYMGKVAGAEQTSVLITGESGTGKELVARGIHYLSSRKEKFFHSVNCSAIPESLFESEFFGHVKGAFTGAITDKAGWFEIANGGTLFLDEIGDTPLHQQMKLLRVLETGTLKRIGSTKEITVDVRVISATNKFLPDEVAAKNFRLDLYHRLSRFIINVPALRERREDIPLLLEYYREYFAQKLRRSISGFAGGLVAELSKYHYPGNIRELKNMVENAIVLADDVILKKEDFPLLNKLQSQNAKHGYTTYNLAANEKKLIREALEACDYNKTKAAELLGLNWNALDRRIRKYNLERD